MYPLFLYKRKYFIEWAYVTSGEGMDYHIVNKSAGFPIKYERKVITHSMVPAYLSPTQILNKAVRVFRLNNQFMGISFIEYAGKDELNRPARMASNVLIVEKELYNIISDPLFYENYLKRLKESKENLIVTRNELIDYIPSYYNTPSTKKFLLVADIFNEEQLSIIVSSLLVNKRIAIFGGDNIEIYNTKSDGGITSYDVLRYLMFVLPKAIRVNLEYSTYSSSIDVTNNELFFIDKLPEYKFQRSRTKDTVVIDLSSGKVWNKHINRLGKKYTRALFSSLKNGELPRFILLSDLLTDSYIELISTSGNRRIGFKRMEIILSVIEHLMGGGL